MAKISDEDIASVFDSLKGLSNDELKQLAEKIDSLPHENASHLSRFVRAHIQKKAPRRDPFKGTSALTQKIFDLAKEQGQ